MRLVIRCTAISLAVGGPFMFFLLWYWGSDDVRPSDIPGTYILRNHDVASSLTLQSDQTFQEEIAANEQVRRAHGSWKLVGESGLIFSPEFLPLPGQTIDPGGAADADITKRFGVIWINLHTGSSKLAFQKKLLRH